MLYVTRNVLSKRDILLSRTLLNAKNNVPFGPGLYGRGSNSLQMEEDENKNQRPRRATNLRPYHPLQRGSGCQL